MNKKSAGFIHAGNIGDVHSSIPAMKQYWINTGKKIDLYLTLDAPGFYYEGAVHPTKDERGENVMLNQKAIDMMIPLYEVQPWCNTVKKWEGEEFLVDLNQIRVTYVGMPNFSINMWYSFVYPDLASDLSQKWLEVPDSDKDFAKGMVLINRTERYRSENVDYSFLKPYEDSCLFIGTMREYNNFCMNYNLNIKKLHVNNFLEYAQAVKQCDFYISNQSQGFQLAEGLKHPRILEACGYAANVIPIGEKAYAFLHQRPLEYYFHLLYGDSEGYLAALKSIQDEEFKKMASEDAIKRLQSATQQIEGQPISVATAANVSST